MTMASVRKMKKTEAMGKIICKSVSSQSYIIHGLTGAKLLLWRRLRNTLQRVFFGIFPKK